MITSTDLELKSTLTLGTLESNAEAIQAFVNDKLKEYTPANYVGKTEEAKADRAILNAAEKTLNSKRLELERQYMEPFNKFKGIISDTCKAIKQASAELDAIVKGEEEREKAAKFEEIQKYWDSTGFSLFDISKVFNQKWTNKTTKIKDIQKEIDQIQKKAFDDLKVLDNFPAEDVPLLKTVYLDTLDISQAMAKAEQLKDNRDRLAREKTEREAIEQRRAREEQRLEETKDINEECAKDAIDNLANEALGLDIQEEKVDERQEYALVLRGTFDQLMEVRKFMTNNGVTYTKLHDKGNGVYTAE